MEGYGNFPASAVRGFGEGDAGRARSPESWKMRPPGGYHLTALWLMAIFPEDRRVRLKVEA
jgi:hypothetical protein